MSRGTALALSAMIGICAVAGSARRILHGLDAADAGQVDVHQDHLRLIGARELDAEVAVRGAQQAQVGAARDELLDQLQVGRIVFDVEQGAQRRAVGACGRTAAPRRSASRAASCGAAVRLSSIQNTLPTPTVLSTPMAPPISSTSRLVTTRPMPVPSSAPASLPEAVERLEQLRELLRRQARAGVPDADADAIRRARGALHDDRAARLVVLDRVEQQVDQDLLDPGPVGFDEAGDLEARKGHADAALLRLRLDHGPALEHDLDQRDRLPRQRHLARLDQREIEDLVDQLQQVPAGLEDLVEASLLRGRRRRRAGFHELGETEDRVERRAQFVAHAGEEIRFRAVGLLRGGHGLVQFRLRRACARNCRCRSAGSR